MRHPRPMARGTPFAELRVFVQTLVRDRALSFIVYCPTTRLAILLDPVAETWRYYEDILRRDRLSLTAVIGCPTDIAAIDAPEAVWPCPRIACGRNSTLRVDRRRIPYVADSPPIEMDDGRLGPCGPSTCGVDLRFGSVRLSVRPRFDGPNHRLVALIPGPNGALDPTCSVDRLAAGQGATELAPVHVGRRLALAGAGTPLSLPKDPEDISIIPLDRADAGRPERGPRRVSLPTDREGWRLTAEPVATPAPVPSQKRRLFENI